MIKRTQTTKKAGFSLIEIMFLFTILAVIMAATVPVITKKSSPIPAKITHGVYRCIADPVNAGYIQELYTGTRKVSGEHVAACSFNVPKSSVYKVDMYTAGSGGTIDAEITTQEDDVRNEYYELGSGDSHYGDTSKAKGNTQLEKITFDQVFNAFKGTTVIKSHYTGRAGKGGSAELVYDAPNLSSCAGQGTIYSEATDAYTDAKAKYDTALAGNETYQDLLDERDDLQGEINKIKEGIGLLNDNYILVENTFKGIDYVETLKGYVELYLQAIDNKDSISEEQLDGLKDAYLFIFKEDSPYGVDLIALQQTNFPNAPMIEMVAVGSKYTELTLDKLDFAIDIEGHVTGGTATGGGTSTGSGSSGSGSEDYKSLNDSIIKSSGAKANFEALWDAISGTTTSDGLLYRLKSQKSSLYPGFKSLVETYFSPITVDESKSPDSTLGEIRFNLDDNPGSSINLPKKYSALHECELKIAAIEEDTANACGLTAAQNKLAELDKMEGSDNYLKTYLEMKGTGFYGNDSVFDSLDYHKVNDQFKTFCKIMTDKDGATINKSTRNISESGGEGGKGMYQTIEYIVPGSKGPGAADARDYITWFFSSSRNWGLYQVLCDKTDIEHVAVVPEGRCTSSFLESSLLADNGSGVSINYDEHKNELYDKDSHPDYKFHLSGTTRYIQGGKGQDMKDLTDYENNRYIGWRIPPETKSGWSSTTTSYTESSSEHPTIVSLVNTLPTGGTGAKIKIEEIDSTEVVPELTSEEIALAKMTEDGLRDLLLNKLFKTDFSYKITAEEGAPGEDVAMSPPIYFKGTTKIYAQAPATSLITSQVPRLYVKSELWSKYYKLGKAGNKGNSSHTTETSLGAHCDMTVPHSGQPYDQTNKAISTKALQDELTVSMTCYDKEGKTVYYRKVDGPSYNTGLLNYSEGFHWYYDLMDGEGHTKSSSFKFVTPQYPDDANTINWKPTSLWAKVFEFMMNSSNIYDLNDKNVGAAGLGTQLDDFCIEPRGSFKTERKYYINTLHDGVKEDDITVSSYGFKNVDHKYNGIHVGSGYNCYGVDPNDTTTKSGTIKLTTEENFISGSPYKNLGAGHGGGGAIVITW